MNIEETAKEIGMTYALDFDSLDLLESILKEFQRATSERVYTEACKDMKVKIINPDDSKLVTMEEHRICKIIDATENPYELSKEVKQ